MACNASADSLVGSLTKAKDECQSERGSWLWTGKSYVLMGSCRGTKRTYLISMRG